eukprot:1160804-Pelagomonas_calceolata.AAC.4
MFSFSKIPLPALPPFISPKWKQLCYKLEYADTTHEATPSNFKPIWWTRKQSANLFLNKVTLVDSKLGMQDEHKTLTFQQRLRRVYNILMFSSISCGLVSLDNQAACSDLFLAAHI